MKAQPKNKSDNFVRIIDIRFQAKYSIYTIRLEAKYKYTEIKDGDRMDCKEIREMYKLMFAEYPDIVTVKDLQAMLGISRHAAYDLLGEGEISCIRLANAYKIPKINVINYVLKSPCGQTRVSA